MKNIKNIFTRKVIISGILLALILCGLVFVFQIGVFPYMSINSDQKAIVITTPVVINPADANENSTGNPTPTSQNLPGVVSLGMTVKVAGTGDTGLRMRAEPGTEQPVLFLANENEVFSIVDGPIIQDSLIWWKIQGLQDNQKLGWSVQDYLVAAEP